MLLLHPADDGGKSGTGVGAAGLAPAAELDGVDPAVALLDLVDKGVRLLEDLAKLGLGQAGFFADRFEPLAQTDVVRVMLRVRAS